MYFTFLVEQKLDFTAMKAEDNQQCSRETVKV